MPPFRPLRSVYRLLFRLLDEMSGKGIFPPKTERDTYVHFYLLFTHEPKLKAHSIETDLFS